MGILFYHFFKSFVIKVQPEARLPHQHPIQIVEKMF